MRTWFTGGGVAVAAFVAGLLFQPVFGSHDLVVTLAAALAAVSLVDGVALLVRALAPIRPVLAIVAGGVAAVAATGRPLGAWVPTLLAAARDGWYRTAETTWPVTDRPDLLLFVPILAVLATVLGLELLRRGRSPLLALAPATAELVLAQAYEPVRGHPAVFVALAFTLVAAGVCLAAAEVRPSIVRGAATGLVLTVAGIPVAAATIGWSVAHRPPAQLRADLSASPVRAESPLDDIAGLLSKPDQVAFNVRTSAPADRWTLVVYTGFDGANWTAANQYRPLGGSLAADPQVRVPVQTQSATVQPVELPGPWLPSRTHPESVAGATVLVDPIAGTLLADQPTKHYELTWSAPEVADGALSEAAVDPAYGGAMDLGRVPGALSDFARKAVDDEPPSFRTAKHLEAFFRDHYKLATGAPLPTGHGYAQLQHFLGTTKRGTSEQFATAYVVLARLLGIPARLAVGYRQPAQPGADGTTVVHNRDVLAWPEIAVAGYGWIALDPTNTLHGTSGKADVADADNPTPKVQPTQSAINPPTPTPSAPSAGSSVIADPPPALSRGSAVLVAGLLALAGFLIGVPVAKRARRGLRQRGTPTAMVAGAWRESVDQLREFRVPVNAAMTTRDCATVAGPDVAPSLLRLAVAVDEARWSGRGGSPGCADAAWQAVAQVHIGLKRRGRWQRLRALYSLGSWRWFRNGRPRLGSPWPD
jgi:protein-glutamine gamma-glutamyltransferase